MPRRRALLLTCLFVLTPLVAKAQSWKSGKGNGHIYIEISSVKRGAALRIECGDDQNLWLRYYPPREWDGAAKVSVRSGNYVAILSNVTGNG